MRIHPLAASGFADAADAYERGRPEYPVEAIDLLRRQLDLRPGVRVLDLGAGTGKLTRPLLACGARVVAVEPQAAMRARLPSTAEVLAVAAEELPLADASVDGAVAGDAWHWFDAERVAAELARVLRPGGAVALLWQRPRADGEPPPWAHRLGELLLERRADHPGFGSAAGQQALDARGPFAPLARHDVPFVYQTDRDGLLAYVGSISFIASLPEAERAELLGRVRDLVPDGPVRLPLETQVWITRLGRRRRRARPGGRPAAASRRRSARR